MPTLQEQQAPIDEAIISAMIAVTPETWKVIRLSLEREPGNRAVGHFIHELASPEGHPPVGADEGIFEATYNLDSLLQAHGGFLRRAEYVAQEQDGKWSYKSKFEYEKGAL